MYLSCTYLYILAFPSANQSICVQSKWCTEIRNYSKVNIVIVRFDLTDDDAYDNGKKGRIEVARDWIEKQNDTFQGMGEWVLFNVQRILLCYRNDYYYY